MTPRILLVWFALVGACNRTPEPGPSPRKTGEPQSQSPKEALPEAGPACVVPLAEQAPAVARPAPTCPPDPAGQPLMPQGHVQFVEAPNAPRLDVELAQTIPHRTHGLMYRQGLSDTEGMLFSWPTDEPRSFWMKNTCIPLDMLFIDSAGFVAGVLEQVPPMNEKPRGIGCPVAHVLEVPAGWTRRYGIEPGQKVAISPEPE